MSIFQKIERGMNSTNFNYPLDVDFSDSLIKQKFGHIKNLNDGDTIIEYREDSLTDYCNKYDTDIDYIYSMRTIIDLNGVKVAHSFKTFPNETLSKLKIVLKDEAYPMLIDYSFVNAFQKHKLNEEEIIFDCFERNRTCLNLDKWEKICEESMELFNFIKNLKEFDYNSSMFNNELSKLYDEYYCFCNRISRTIFTKIIESYFSMNNSLVKDLSIVEDGSRKFYWDSSSSLKTADSVYLFSKIELIIMKKDLLPNIKKLDQEFKEFLSL